MSVAVELLVRNRFFSLPGVVATQLAANAWELAIPRTDDVRKLSKRGDDPEAWDEAIFSIDGVQSEPAIGSGFDATTIRVTVLVLG